LYSECLSKETLDGLGDFNIGGQIIQTLKYADDLVLMAKEETVLQGMINNLIETGSCYGMEMNVEKNKSNENFKTVIPSNNYDRPKKLENVECFKYLGSMLTNDKRCTCEIQDFHGKSCIQQEEDSFYQQIGLKFEEETNKMLHMEHGFVWC